MAGCRRSGGRTSGLLVLGWLGWWHGEDSIDAGWPGSRSGVGCAGVGVGRLRGGDTDAGRDRYADAHDGRCGDCVSDFDFGSDFGSDSDSDSDFGSDCGWDPAGCDGDAMADGDAKGDCNSGSDSYPNGHANRNSSAVHSVG